MTSPPATAQPNLLPENEYSRTWPPPPPECFPDPNPPQPLCEPAD